MFQWEVTFYRRSAQMTSLMHKHADIAIYTLRCKVTKENDFSKYVKPKTAIMELSSNVKCRPFANLRTSAVICHPSRLRRSPLCLQPGVSTQFDEA